MSDLLPHEKEYWSHWDTHSPDKCVGRPCPVHNPSDHHMRSWPLNYRPDRGLTERLCHHGVGHPDPDDPSKHRRHGCCGCCTPPASRSPSGIEALVCTDIAQRQQKGIAKYGVTVADNPLELRAWVQHAYEECLDQAVYLRRIMEELDKKLPQKGQPTLVNPEARPDLYPDWVARTYCKNCHHHLHMPGPKCEHCSGNAKQAMYDNTIG